MTGEEKRISPLEGVNALRNAWDRWAENALEDDTASIEDIVNAVTNLERVSAHQHNQIIRVQKIDNDRYKASANGQVIGMMKGKTFKLLAGFAIFSGGVVSISGAAQLGPRGVFEVLNNIGGTLGIGDIVDIALPVADLQTKARGLQDLTKAMDAVKGVGDQVFGAKKNELEEEKNSAASKSMHLRQDTETQGQYISRIQQEAQQKIQAAHDAKSGAAQAIGGR